jgi:uncharacterized membrane protein YgcG
MRFGLVSVIYIVVGVLVAAGIIGNEANYFSNLGNLEEIIEMLLAVFLWPLVLLDVNMNIGGDSGGGGGSGGSGGGGAEGGGGGDKK